MTYNYLLELHEQLEAALAAERRSLESSAGLERERRRGALETLEAFDQYLREHLDPHLPRRLRARAPTTG